MNYNCLIVDDEKPLADSTAEYFNLFEVTTKAVYDAEACLAFLKENQVDLLLLDINLEKSSGFDLCRTLRMTTNIPILFISARQSDDDIILALNIGGDDYIRKPYSLSVLLAKVKAMLKRFGEKEEQMYQHDGLLIDFNTRQVTMHQQPVKLKAMEYKLLCYLIKNKNRAISKEEIFENVWEDSITSDGTLNVHIRHLREKIEKDANAPERIKTIWGVGYIYEVS
ncbi:MAG: response regulator transcription factor [Coprobacillaceae bacterium]